MLSAKKRGNVWRIEGMLEVTPKKYVRLSLSTHDRDAAKKLVSEIELALIDGKDSKRWPEPGSASSETYVSILRR